MVFIVDDTPREQIEKLFNPSDFEDVATICSDLSLDDIHTLETASCILVHSSYHNSAVKKKLCGSISDYGERIPLVLFSDGDLPDAVFDGPSYITEYKKSELYSKLPLFLSLFRETGTVNLEVLAFGRQALGRKTPKLDGRIFIIGDCDLGNSIGIPDADYSPLPEVQPAREKDVHDYMMSAIKGPISALVLFTDSCPAFCLDLAMHVRLSKDQLGQGHLCPIVFVSSSGLASLLTYGQSQIFLTGSIYVCRKEELAAVLDNAEPLSPESFRSSFLNRINIQKPEGNNHSLANQWGASRLFRIVSGRDISPEEYKDFNDVQKELYYKYILNRISRQFSGPAYAYNEKIQNSIDKKILLIDDEADKGWAKTIARIFPISLFNPDTDVICERVPDYESLSDEARNKIENGGYDLFLLDLRLNGAAEDAEAEPQNMSGYKVLHRIKSFNRGNQVIMLTASNKAWNLKAILNPLDGASGYFVKESPEYEFSDAFSIANLDSFRKDAELCFDRGYLRKFWECMESVRMAISGESTWTDFLKEMYSQMNIAFGLCAQADSAHGFQYAYLSLFQILEVVMSHYVFEEFNKTTKVKSLWIKDDNGNRIPCYEVARSSDRFIYRCKPSTAFVTSKDHKVFGQRDKISALFLQLWNRQDNGFIYLLEQLIQVRNDLIHKNELGRFEGLRKVPFTSVFSYRDLNDGTLVFHEDAILKALNGASMKEYMYDGDNGHLMLHPGIADSYVGVTLLAECVMKIASIILERKPW